MARGRRSAGPEVSLFPFLSILACLIGALTMLIVALSLMEILQGREDDSIARAEDYVALQREVAANEQEILRLETDLKRTNAAAAELAEVVAKVEKVRGEVEKLEKTAGSRDPLEEKLARLEETKKALVGEQQALEAEVIAGKENEGVMARQRAQGDPIEILSAANFFRKVSPTFVEVRAADVVVHTRNKVVAIKRGALAQDPDFKKVVNFVQEKDDRIIVFLIREDGRATYHAARNVARQGGAVTSKLPLVGDGEINLRQFFRKKGA